MFAQQISYYKILQKLGAGGMGEVYLAEDTRLNRKIALKILPESISQDRKHLSRFLREASLAANLNHPNICTIYEVSGDGETPFIAMEYIEGETLADKIQSAALDLNDVLELSIQIADALDEAHHQSIIHRDIKAANIIINRRGQAKILDFGLAKTIVEEVSDEAVTRAKTEAGILVGTVRYMSPEQSLGKTLDGRTDLWSLGVLLYEMLAGEAPFRGDTQVATFDEILHKQPVALTEINSNIPAELEKIVLKLLEKDREYRYQTASDLRADLKRLQKNTSEINFNLAENRRVSPGENAPVTGFVKTQTGEIVSSATGNVKPVITISRVWFKPLVALGLLVLLFGIGFAVYQFVYKNRMSVSFEKRESQRLTNLGNVVDAVISADGKYLVYVQDDGSLWLKQIATGSMMQVVAPANVVFQGLTVSADGNWIYYNIWDRRSVGEIFRVSTLGGVPQKIVHDCMPGLSVSPDGRQIAFIRSYDKEKLQNLIIADIENREKETPGGTGYPEKVLLSDGWYGGIYAFEWAPDGASLAVVASRRSESGEFTNVLSEISIADGREKLIWKIPSKVRDFKSGLTWKPDKSGILAVIAETQDPFSQIWEISYANGEATQLTKDFNSYGRISITADGKNLASVQEDYASSLWVLPTDNPAQAAKLTNGKTEGMNAAWTPDDRIIYTSTVGGSVDVWIMDASGENKKQLTSDAYLKSTPCMTFDKKSIAFASNRNSGGWNIWLMNTDGTNLRQLIQSGAQWRLHCSKIENAIYYKGVAGGKEAFWKIPVGGGEPSLGWTESPFAPDISPDEKQLAYSIWNPDKKRLEQQTYTLAGKKIETIEFPPTAIGEGGKEPSFKWTADGQNYSFLNEEKTVPNIWLKSVAGGKLKKFTDFNENRIIGYDWSPDGKKLLVTRGNTSTDVVLLKEK